MTQQAQAPASRFTVVDLAKAVPGLVKDSPTLLTGAVGLVAYRPTSKMSIGKIFQRAAETHPGRDFLRYQDQIISYGEANDRVNQYAAALAAQGVGHGSVVGVLMTNRPENVLLMLAIVKLGAVAGLLNYNQRGEVLNHSQTLLGSTVLAVGAECREALDSIPSGDLRGKVMGVDVNGQQLAGFESLDALADTKPTDDPASCEQVRANAKAFFIFTSGTTGLPKASTMTHLRWIKAMMGFGKLGVRLRPDDVLYCCLPLYHNNAMTVSLSSVLSAGCTLALGKSFSASRFWDEAIALDATAFTYIGELCRYLLAQPSKPTDRAHRIRVVVGNGLRPEIWQEFKTRFGIERISEFYGASECNLAFVNALNLDYTAGTCPLPYAVVAYDRDTDAAARDRNGRLTKVAKGDVGLLITKITGRSPFDGYTDADATEKKVIRNAFKSGDQWFNTGDLVRDQGFHHVAFVDRMGDTFRWKGENVATTEVEAELTEFGPIEQAVVYGVAVPGTDGKAGMAAIKLRNGATFDGLALARFLTAQLPAYAVPLFVRIIDEVAQTSTFKSSKVDLRNEGYDSAVIVDPLYVLAGHDKGYVPYYDGYAKDVAEGHVRV